MASTKFLGCLVAALAVVLLSIVSVSANFGDISSVKVSDVEALPFGSVDIAAFAGQTIPVRVIFDATLDAEDARVKAWISGERELAAITERFDVIAGRTYSRVLSVQVPRNLDELDESLELNVVVENRDIGVADEESISLTLQRESYVIEILDAEMPDNVNAGDLVPVDIVLKNRGRKFADDTFVRVRIPQLNIEDRAFFGDLSPVDQPIVEFGNFVEKLDKEDAAERRLFLRIPSTVPAGTYIVEVEAFNEDSSSMVSKRIVISGAESRSEVVAPVHSKSFDAGSNAEYDLVLVNSGNQLRVYELVIESPADLDIDLSESVLAVPAGESRTVKIGVSAEEAGAHNFAVNIHSGTQLVKREEFTANVQEGTVTAASPTVLLTVILAVIFIVLLIVLIVLLTRRPSKEEVGESYY